MPPLCESFSCNFATQDISDLKSHSFCSQHFRYTENFLCCCCLSVWWVKFLISDIITLKIWDCSRYSDNSNGVFHLHDVTSELTCLARGHVSRRVSMPGLLGPDPSVAQCPAPAPGQPIHWFLEFLNFGINIRRMHPLQGNSGFNHWLAKSIHWVNWIIKILKNVSEYLYWQEL